MRYLILIVCGDYLRLSMDSNRVQDSGMNCIYMWKSKECVIYLALYVDNLLIAVHKCFVKCKWYKMTELGHVAKLLGLNIHQIEDNTYITIGQGEYIPEMLKKLGLENIPPVSHSHQNVLRLTKNSCKESTIDMQLAA